MIVFESERLCIRRTTLDDAGFLFRQLTQPPWLQYIGHQGVTSPSASAAWSGGSTCPIRRRAPGIRHLLAITTTTNERSGRVRARAGFRLETDAYLTPAGETLKLYVL